MMKIKKANGTLESVDFNKITHKIQSLCKNLHMGYIDPGVIAKKTIEGIYDGITTKQIDKFSAEICAGMSIEHPDYNLLGGRLLVSRLHKDTHGNFAKVMYELYDYIDEKTGKRVSLIPEDIMELVEKHKHELNNAIDYTLDYTYDFFAYRTLEKSYLLRKNGDIIERPQDLLMRVALGIHKSNITNVLKSYQYISKKYYTHASPTLFNAGTRQNQMSSCFLVAMKDDSLSGIYDTLKECALISKSGAGIGIHVHNVRSSGSYIAGTNGHSNGIIPMLQVFNHTARYVDQGGGKRKGSFAIYLEPWHPEILEFLELRKNHGKEEQRTRDLFTALWIPDLFMKRVENNEKWSLFCPSEAKKLSDVYGDEFEALYTHYEQQGKAKKVLDARKIWDNIIESQIETGTPYMVYKDTSNRKSNQKNLGIIKSSNLCTEIIEYSSPEETAVCNLASLSLPHYVRNGSFDFKLFEDIVYHITKSMNKVIEYNFYPIETARRSNMKHRPIGFGVQGLADCFMLLKLPFESEKAHQLNKDIFETLYYSAMRSSIDLAKKEGPYSSFDGSPLSQGLFQFDLWGKQASNRYDWETLRTDVKQYGARNSLLVAPMPTASTSQILGNNECFEPYTSNMYKRRTLSGEYAVINKHLIRDLIASNLWNESIRKQIMTHQGSIQNIPEIPTTLKDIYKTVWEIKQKTLIDMAADRGPYVCQSQSLNLFMKNPTYSKLTSMHFYSWKKGLKTGIYYLRSTAATEAQAFTLNKSHTTHPESIIISKNEVAHTSKQCSTDGSSECEMCQG